MDTKCVFIPRTRREIEAADAGSVFSINNETGVRH